MEQYRVLFDSLEWQSLVHGARFKAFRSGTKQLRLVEFTSEFVEPDWCEKGHIGFVIQGELEINFLGNLVRYPEGSGIFIPPGSTSSHKGRSVTPATLLFLVEDI
jgi:quercetin dioxygenase-like cupin family protein